MKRFLTILALILALAIPAPAHADALVSGAATQVTNTEGHQDIAIQLRGRSRAP